MESLNDFTNTYFLLRLNEFLQLKEIENAYVINFKDYSFKIYKVRVIGEVKEIHVHDKYTDIIISDNTGEMLVRAWGDLDNISLKQIKENNIIEVFGKIRKFRDKIYLSPDIILVVDETAFSRFSSELKQVRQIIFSKLSK